MRKNYLLFVCCCVFSSRMSGAVSFIIFSYNRPIQLYALLESCRELLTGVDNTTIIYRADNDAYELGYDVVKKDFTHARFVRQSVANPYGDFKQLILNAVRNASSHVMFAVDDMIVKEPVDVAYCANMLEQTGAYGFYLRLGAHVDYCYSENKYQGIPPYTSIQDDVLCWEFVYGRYDWRYPNAVDMTVYKRNTLLSAYEQLNFCSPNSLEGRWATYKCPPLNYRGLFFKRSKVINIPLNVVQHDWGNYQQGNRNMQAYTAQQLLDLFNQGLKIDIKELRNVKNRSAHMEHTPTFIKR